MWEILPAFSPIWNCFQNSTAIILCRNHDPVTISFPNHHTGEGVHLVRDYYNITSQPRRTVLLFILSVTWTSLLSMSRCMFPHWYYHGGMKIVPTWNCSQQKLWIDRSTTKRLTVQLYQRKGKLVFHNLRNRVTHKLDRFITWPVRVKVCIFDFGLNCPLSL